MSANTITLSALIADGDAGLRQELAGHLERFTGRVLQAPDGASATRLFHEHVPDILIVGMLLPDMDGGQLVERLRELDPEAPVLMLHHGNTPEAALQALELNITVFMRTPLDPDTLRTHLNRITSQLLLARRLREARSALEHLLNLHPTFAVLVEDGKVAYLNRRFLEYFGFKTFEQYQANPGAFDSRLVEINGQAYQGKNDSWIALLTDDPLDRDHLVRFADPRHPERGTRTFSVAFNRFSTPGRALFTFAEAGELDEERAALESRACIDPLTGALNRRNFLDKLFRAQQRMLLGGEPFSLIMFDIDRFKAVNETFGRAAGDGALKELTNLVLENIREGDCLGRWSGEEFMLLEPHAGLDSARRLAERLRSGIAAHEFRGISHALTGSFGVVQHLPGEDMDDLIRRVAQVLTRARNSGGDCVAAE